MTSVDKHKNYQEKLKHFENKSIELMLSFTVLYECAVDAGFIRYFSRSLGKTLDTDKNNF